MYRREPFELAVLGACATLGAVYLIDGCADLGIRSPDTLTAQLEAWQVTAWHLLLLASGLLGLVGLAWRDRPTGLLLERVGMGLLTAGGPIYGVTLLIVAWPTSIAAGTVWTALGVAAAARAVQITLLLRRARQAPS